MVKKVIKKMSPMQDVSILESGKIFKKASNKINRSWNNQGLSQVITTHITLHFKITHAHIKCTFNTNIVILISKKLEKK